MKKIILIATLLVSSATLNAQLKVSEQGNVMVGYDITKTPKSLLSLGCEGNNRYVMNIATSENRTTGLQIDNVYPIQNREGIYVQSGTSDNYSSTSIKTQNFGNTNGLNIGVQSIINDSPAQGMALCGILSSKAKKGAAVYGGVATYMSMRHSGLFAGYFYGDILATGKIYGTVLSSYPATLTSPLAIQPANSTQPNGSKGNSAMFEDKLTNLQLVSYEEPKYEPIYGSDSRESANDEMIGEDTSGIRDVFDTAQNVSANEKSAAYEPAFKSKSDVRYALEINSLAENFPEFVYEDGEGNRCVDYVGMIPLLVESIGRLRARVAELEKAQDNPVRKSTPASTAEVSEIDAEDITIVELAQNKPNPFDVSTNITVTLPESVKNALLMVYDMNGKPIRQMRIEERGSTNVTLHASDFYKGMFLYTLVTDGKAVNTKKMIIM